MCLAVSHLVDPFPPSLAQSRCSAEIDVRGWEEKRGGIRRWADRWCDLSTERRAAIEQKLREADKLREQLLTSEDEACEQPVLENLHHHMDTLAGLIE